MDLAILLSKPIIGILFKDFVGHIHQLVSPTHVYSFESETEYHVVQLGLGDSEIELTTAFNCGIDPEKLKIPEPYWTGYCVSNKNILYIHFFDGTEDLFKDGQLVFHTKRDECRPCLRPKN